MADELAHRDPRVRRRAVHMLVGVLAATAVAGAVTSTPAAAGLAVSAAGTTLDDAAATSGRYFGARVPAGRLTTMPFVDIVSREFSSVTPEHELVWDAVEPQRGQFNFGPAERVLAFAQTQGALVRGHSLAWHARQPAWANQLNGPALRAAMINHVRTVAGHFRGRIHSWDVASEAFEDNGARRNSNLQRSGADWIEVALRTARDADPNARLCYDDYHIEGESAKSDAVFAMVADFRARGVPIDCVGVQGHFLSNFPLPARFQATMERFAALGVQVQLTELDVNGTSDQPEVYARVMRTCLAVARCVGLTVSAVRDSDSWRSSELPALFDRDGNPKPAYFATLAALNEPGVPADPPYRPGPA